MTLATARTELLQLHTTHLHQFGTNTSHSSETVSRRACLHLRHALSPKHTLSSLCHTKPQQL